MLELAQEPHRLAPGDLLGEVYEIRGVLGAGGMGEVFEAYDRRLGREVAIKVSRPGLAAEVLHGEARALAGLAHPAVVTVHALGIDRDVAYMVMERLHGRTLAEHLARVGRFTLDEALELLIKLADALATLHRAGLVHRDLKPSNIMLAPGDRLVLLDLGSALVADAGRDYFAGTPEYLAPEMVAGRLDPDLEGMIDLYAMGVIACEILIGAPPFVGGEAREIFEQHLTRRPPRLRQERPDVPAQLDRLVGELLAKEPRHRPPSAEAVSVWLRGIRRGGAARAPGLSVLIADDDPDLRAILTAVVKDAAPNARVRDAENGVEALERFRAEVPDVLLLDLQMPRMSGIELCMYLRGSSLAAQTTIVAVSACASGEDRRLLAHLGVVDFLDKKAAGVRLVDELRALLGDITRARLRGQVCG